MPLHQESRFGALLARFEEEHGDMLRRRREQAAARAAFLERFRHFERCVVAPCLTEIADRLQARGLTAFLSHAYLFEPDASGVEQSILLTFSTRPLKAREMYGPEPGLAFLADGNAQQVRLGTRSLGQPKEEHVTVLPLLEQWTAELIEEDILAALDQVFFA